MTLNELKERLKEKKEITIDEFNQLAKIANDDKSKKGLFNENRRIRNYFIKHFDEISGLIQSKDIYAIISQNYNDDNLNAKAINLAQKYLENHCAPQNMVVINARHLSKIFNMSYCIKSGEKSLHASDELRTYLEEHFSRVIQMLSFDGISSLIAYLKKSKNIDHFSMLFRENIDAFLEELYKYSNLDSKTLFNNDLENVYYMFGGNFDKLVQLLQKKGDVYNLFKDIPLGNLKDFPDFKKEIFEVMKNLVNVQDISNQSNFDFLLIFLPELGELDLLEGRVEELFNLRSEVDYRFKNLAKTVIKYHHISKETGENTKIENELLKVLEQSFKSGNLNSELDFELFIKTIYELDKDFFTNNIEGITKLASKDGVNSLLYILSEKENNDIAVNTLNSQGTYLAQISSEPLRTIDLMKRIYAKKLNSSPEINEHEKQLYDEKIEEFKTIIDGRTSDIVAELSSTNKVMASISDTLAKIIEDLAKYHEGRPSEIEKIGQGGFSKVFKMGSKVIKVGFPIAQYEITKNCPIILQPLIRLSLDKSGFMTEKGPLKGYLEVAELCDKPNPTTITEYNEMSETLYDMYKKIREYDLVWTDVTSLNIGKLRKPNKVYFGAVGEVKDDNSIIWGETAKAGPGTGLSNEDDFSKDDILQAGEYVVIDIDYIFPCPKDQDATKVPNIKWPATRNAKQLEKRYLAEKGIKSKDNEVKI